MDIEWNFSDWTEFGKDLRKGLADFRIGPGLDCQSKNVYIVCTRIQTQRASARNIFGRADARRTNITTSA